ncbi:MAG: hypothetical protein K0R25_1112 [Rickettsiaceae bacterium]|jgi:hypothetical protein|nr:hypothetical protein [Rickettsiaceae bacterium]
MKPELETKELETKELEVSSEALLKQEIELMDVSERSSFLKSYLKEPQNNFSFDFLIEAAASLRVEWEYRKVMEAWIEKPTNKINADYPRFLLKKHYNQGAKGYDYDYCSAIQSFFLVWLEEPENNLSLDEVKEISLSLSEYRDESLFVKWLKKPENNLSLDELKQKLSSVSEYQDNSLLLAWIEKPENKRKISFNSIIELSSNSDPDDEDDVNEIIEIWVEGRDFDFIQRQSLLNLDKENLFRIAGLWISSLPSEILYENFVKVISSDLLGSEYRNDVKKVVELCKGLGFPDTDIPNLCNDLYPNNEAMQIALLDAYTNLLRQKLRVMPPLKHSSFLESYLKDPKHNFSFDFLIETFSLSSDYRRKYDNILKVWLKKPENKISFNDLKGRLEKYFSQEKNQHNSREIYSFFLSWIKEPGNKIGLDEISFNSIKELSSDCGFEEDVFEEIITKWVRDRDFDFIKGQSLLVSEEDFVKIAVLWLCSLPPEILYENLVKVIGSNLIFNKYSAEDVEDICNYTSLTFPNILNLCHDLYPNNEMIQADLFNACIESEMFEKTEENLSIIKKFLSNLKQDDIALDFLRGIENELELSNLDILKIAEGRIHANYQSMARLLGKAKLEECVTKAGLKILKELFGSNISETATLSSIFSYYDIKDDMEGFISILNPEFHNEIIANFFLPEKYLYISGKERKKLKALTGKSLPSMHHLSSYLQRMVPPIPGLSDELISNCQINFEDSTIAVEKQPEILAEFKTLLSKSKAELTKEKVTSFFKKVLNLEGEISEEILAGFKELLAKSKEEQKDEVSDQEVISFFKKALNLKDEVSKNNQEKLLGILADFKELITKPEKDLTDQEVIISFLKKALGLEVKINEDNQTKLLDFFADNKNELVCLFQTKEGIGKFASCIQTLGDGCVANIATQFNLALYQSLITDPCAQILYSVFSQKIAPPILNGGGDNLTSDTAGINPLQAKIINDSFISPNGLIAELRKSFRDDKGKLIAKYNDLVKDLIGGEEKMAELLERLDSDELSEEKLGDDFSDYEANNINIGVYLILKKSVPRVLCNGYFDQFRKNCETIFPALEKMYNEERKDEALTPSTKVSSVSAIAAEDVNPYIFILTDKQLSRADITSTQNSFCLEFESLSEIEEFSDNPHNEELIDQFEKLGATIYQGIAYDKDNPNYYLKIAIPEAIPKEPSDKLKRDKLVELFGKVKENITDSSRGVMSAEL